MKDNKIQINKQLKIFIFVRIKNIYIYKLSDTINYRNANTNLQYGRLTPSLHKIKTETEQSLLSAVQRDNLPTVFPKN